MFTSILCSKMNSIPYKEMFVYLKNTILCSPVKQAERWGGMRIKKITHLKWTLRLCGEDVFITASNNEYIVLQGTPVWAISLQQQKCVKVKTVLYTNSF